MKTTNEPESRESLFGTALLSASIGAIAFYLTRFYYNFPFAYDSGLLFRGAWALGPLIYLPWMVIVGAMAGRAFGKVRNAKQMFGIMGALSVAVIMYMSVRLISPNFFTGYVRIISYSCLLPSIACFMIGAHHSSRLQRLHDGREVSVMLLFTFLALAVYLVCEYLLRGYTSPLELPLFGIGAVLLYLFSSLGVIVASLCIAGICRSEVAARLTRPLLVRILLIALCVPPSLWQVLMFFIVDDSWRGPMRFVWVASPLFVLIIAGVSRLVKIERAI